MTVFARVMRLLSMVVWVGGLIFFAFVLAPTAFHVLPSTHEAGSVVGATLHVLNEIGLVCGFVFLMAIPWRFPPKTARLLLAEIVCCAGMIASTMVVQWAIVPRMERDRVAAGGDVDAAPRNDPARLDFQRLHPISERVEGAALFMGIAIVVLMAFEPSRPSQTA